MIPAFANIGAITARADGMQVLPHYQVLHAGIIFAIGALHFHPVRQARACGKTVFQSKRVCTKIIMALK
jgi:predicted choloylglycine hydrolase